MRGPSTHDPIAVRDRFIAEHRWLEHTLRRVIDACRAKAPPLVAALWDEFCQQAIAHLQSEEELVLPDIVAARPREASAIMQEHRHLRQRIAALSEGDGLPRVRAEALGVLVDELRAQTAHEEVVLHRWAGDCVGDRHVPAGRGATS